MKDMGYFGECQFCKPRIVGNAGWYSSMRADLTGVVDDTDGGSIPLKGKFYISGNKDDVFGLVHFTPTEMEDGTLTGVDGVVAVTPAFEYCPYCGRRLDDAQDD